MHTRTQAHERAASECQLAGRLGSVVTNLVALAALFALFETPSVILVIIAVVFTATVTANFFGGEVAKIAGICWVAPTTLSGFLIFRNVAATLGSAVVGERAGSGDSTEVAAFFVFSFVLSGLNALFAFLAARSR